MDTGFYKAMTFDEWKEDALSKARQGRMSLSFFSRIVKRYNHLAKKLHAFFNSI